MSDGWETEPFKLVIDEATGRLIGRGASDDKGPVLGWVNVLQWHHDNKKDLPVNLCAALRVWRRAEARVLTSS